MGSGHDHSHDDHDHNHNHDHPHDHSHAHHGHHHYNPNDSSRSIIWGLILNSTFTLVEIAGGALTGSVAVLANAVHDLGDSASLALAVYFERYSRRKRDQDYSFGYRRFSLLSALISGFIILAGSILILRESLPRLWHPPAVQAGGMLGLALLGLAFNGAAAFKLSHGHSQNERMLSWHFIEDTLGWLATLVASAFMKWRGWTWADPILAIALSFFVMWNVFKQLKLTFRLFLQGTPLNFNEKSFVARAKSVAHVRDVHDLHVWSMDGENHVLSMHLIVDSSLEAASVRDVKLAIHEIAHAHHVRHVTIETEFAGEICGDNCDQDKIKA